MPMARRTLPRLAVGLLALVGAPFGETSAAAESITLASTTSTEQSGLFAHLLPQFEDATGITVRVVAQGTGQAMENGRRGDADALLVHDKAAEEQFVAKGFSEGRRDVMYNDYVLVGPAADPAKVAGGRDVTAALQAIAAVAAPFTSRGDDSGTHRAERRFWTAAGVDAAAGHGGWYRETGSGMGPTLNAASAMDAYALTDRATWLAFANKGRLRILVEGDPHLFNPYGILVVNPQHHPHVKAVAARRFADWLVSPAGQAAIAAFRIDGQQPFFPNASTGS